MRSRVVAIPFLTIGMALLASATRADPIRITAGALVGDSFGAHLNATGEREFAISAAGDKVGGIYNPAQQCLGTSCFPGDVLPITASWSGGDFGGVVSIDGETFVIGLTTGEQGSALVSFNDSLMLPQFSGTPLLSVSTPFTFSGTLFYPFLKVRRNSGGRALPVRGSQRYSFSGPRHLAPGCTRAVVTISAQPPRSPSPGA